MTELNLFAFVMNISIIILCGALFTIIPALTRKTFLFGVKVPETAQSHPEAKAMKSR